MLEGRRILITGAARGIGAATARRLHQRGARVALAGLEPEFLAEVARDCGDAPYVLCDVSILEQVDEAVATLANRLDGLDVVIANAGVAAQTPLLGGDPQVFEKTLAVNLLGTYYTLRAASPLVAHEHGYALAIASLAAAVQLPLMGAYNASKAAVEALANTLRIELRPSGARVGVGYFAPIDTEMTSRGFATAASQVMMRNAGPLLRPTPISRAVAAIERGVERRARRVFAPRWVGPVLPARALVHRLVESGTRDALLSEALELAKQERSELTTPQ